MNVDILACLPIISAMLSEDVMTPSTLWIYPFLHTMSLSSTFLPFTHESLILVDSPLVRIERSLPVMLFIDMYAGRK